MSKQISYKDKYKILDLIYKSKKKYKEFIEESEDLKDKNFWENLFKKAEELKTKFEKISKVKMGYEDLPKIIDLEKLGEDNLEILRSMYECFEPINFGSEEVKKLKEALEPMLYFLVK